jgi:transcriptional regulator with XRE-family HTH domain
MWQNTVVMKFADWLLGEMKKKGWSNSDLARESDLSRQAIGYYLNGRTPDNESLRKIARALDVPIEEALRLTGVPIPEEADPWVERMSRRLERLPPELREIAEAMIKVLADRETAERERGHRKKQQ